MNLPMTPSLDLLALIGWALMVPAWGVLHRQSHTNRHGWRSPWLPVLSTSLWVLVCLGACVVTRRPALVVGWQALLGAYAITLAGLALMARVRQGQPGWRHLGPTHQAWLLTCTVLGASLVLLLSSRGGQLAMPVSWVLGLFCLGVAWGLMLRRTARTARLAWQGLWPGLALLSGGLFWLDWSVAAPASPLHGPQGIALREAALTGLACVAPAMLTTVFSVRLAGRRHRSAHHPTASAPPPQVVQALEAAHFDQLLDAKRREDALCDMVLSVAGIRFWVFDVHHHQMVFKKALMDDQGIRYVDDRIPAEAWMSELIHPDDQARVRQLATDQLSTGPSLDLVYRLRMDGQPAAWRWIRSRGVVVQRNADGDPAMLAGTFVDIHEQELARHAQLGDASLFSAGPVVMVRWDFNPDNGHLSRVPFISSNVTALWGYTPQELTSTHQPGQFMEREGLSTLRRHLAECINTGVADVKVSFQVRMADRRKVWHQLHGSIELDDEGGHLNAFLINIDAFQRSQAETQAQREQLKHLVDNLGVTRHEVAILQETSELLNACQAYEEAAHIMSRTMRALLPDWDGILARCIDGHTLVPVSSWGDRSAAPHGELSLHDCWGLRLGKTHCCPHPGVDISCRHFKGKGGQQRASICIPMEANGDIIGSVHLLARRELSDEDIHRHAEQAQRMADAVKLALSNLKLKAQLREDSLQP